VADLLDFGDDATLYFDEPATPGTGTLLDAAAAAYGRAEAESYLLRAYFLAPEQLTVLVALYRYYFYQHRLDDALIVAERAMQAAARRLGLPPDWQRIGPAQVAPDRAGSLPLLRFHLLALKGSAVILLRLGRIDDARARLQKLVDLDADDPLDAASILAVVDAAGDDAAPLPIAA